MDIKNINTHLAITTCPTVTEIMLPKLQQHGVTVFNYYKIYFDGRMVRFSSDQAWTKHFFKKNYMNTMTVPSTYLLKPVNYYVWLTEDCPEMLLDAALNFNTSNGITIAEKQDDYIEYFCFATTLENKRIVNHFYLNNLDLLRKYGYYFKDQAKKLLQQAEKKPFQLTNLEVCRVDSREMEVVYPLFGDLSNRQKECAQLLLQGLKYKDIATELNLSQRTIEFYVDNIKNKLRCNNKTELIIKLNQLF